MVLDAIGNPIKEGDVVLFNNIIYTVKKIVDGNLVGAKSIETVSPGKQKIQGMVIPGNIVLEATIPFDPTKPLNMHSLRVPSNQEQSLIHPGDN